MKTNVIEQENMIGYYFLTCQKFGDATAGWRNTKTLHFNKFMTV